MGIYFLFPFCVFYYTFYVFVEFLFQCFLFGFSFWCVFFLCGGGGGGLALVSDRKRGRARGRGRILRTPPHCVCARGRPLRRKRNNNFIINLLCFFFLIHLIICFCIFSSLNLIIRNIKLQVVVAPVCAHCVGLRGGHLESTRWPLRRWWRWSRITKTKTEFGVYVFSLFSPFSLYVRILLLYLLNSF